MQTPRLSATSWFKLLIDDDNTKYGNISYVWLTSWKKNIMIMNFNEYKISASNDTKSLILRIMKLINRNIEVI